MLTKMGPETNYVIALKPPASTNQVMELQAFTTTPSSLSVLLMLAFKPKYIACAVSALIKIT